MGPNGPYVLLTPWDLPAKTVDLPPGGLLILTETELPIDFDIRQLEVKVARLKEAFHVGP